MPVSFFRRFHYVIRSCCQQLTRNTDEVKLTRLSEYRSERCKWK